MAGGGGERATTAAPAPPPLGERAVERRLLPVATTDCLPSWPPGPRGMSPALTPDADCDLDSGSTLYSEDDFESLDGATAPDDGHAGRTRTRPTRTLPVRRRTARPCPPRLDDATRRKEAAQAPRSRDRARSAGASRGRRPTTPTTGGNLLPKIDKNNGHRRVPYISPCSVISWVRETVRVAETSLRCHTRV